MTDIHKTLDAPVMTYIQSGILRHYSNTNSLVLNVESEFIFRGYLITLTTILFSDKRSDYLKNYLEASQMNKIKNDLILTCIKSITRINNRCFRCRNSTSN
jgi:hypothetical protein